MATPLINCSSTTSNAYVITGPTSGIGYHTALELAKHGIIILVGRNREKLDKVQQSIAQKGQHAVCVQCDLSDVESVRRAATQIVALKLPISGLLNNAGIMEPRATKSTLGWDMSFATNHVGPFALTEALMPHLPDGANVVFIASAVENPERKPAKAVGFRGGRYISAQASARGEWIPDGSKMAGADAYATSKQCALATALVFARENPRLHINAVEPGVNPATSLGQRDLSIFARVLSKTLVPILLPLLMPFMRFLSTPKRAARVITTVMLDETGCTGVYYDQDGKPMQGSPLVHDTGFQDRVVAETRVLLSTVSA